MAEHPRGHAVRAAVSDLDHARRVAFAAADELLGHAPDTGDLAASRQLDGWVDQAADTLRALSEALEERLIDLGATLARATDSDVSAPTSHGAGRE